MANKNMLLICYSCTSNSRSVSRSSLDYSCCSFHHLLSKVSILQHSLIILAGSVMRLYLFTASLLFVASLGWYFGLEKELTL